MNTLILEKWINLQNSREKWESTKNINEEYLFMNISDASKIWEKNKDDAIKKSWETAMINLIEFENKEKSFDIAKSIITLDTSRNFLRYGIGMPDHSYNIKYKEWRIEFIKSIADINLRGIVIFYMLMNKMADYNCDYLIELGMPIPPEKSFNNDIKQFLLESYIASACDTSILSEKQFSLKIVKFISTTIKLTNNDITDFMKYYIYYNIEMNNNNCSTDDWLDIYLYGGKILGDGCKLKISINFNDSMNIEQHVNDLYLEWSKMADPFIELLKFNI